ncbi:glycoside hydrolase [Christiangramia sp.]|uniref:glycoside hydrolase family 113 n=1 Tax=Christiangramia sp. TaxID=1931228 RepID=UPI002632B276|nr:glycoside hydrolase [Christiangramia sp.]
MFYKAEFISLKIVALLALTLIWSCQAEIPFKKINGISLVAARDSLSEKQAERILEINANAVALMPYAFMRDKENPELIFNIERQWFGERAEGIEQSILMLKKKDLKIMIKPHIWLRNGDFTGDLKFPSEADWQKFERSYRNYIMLYAKIAEKHHIEIFCIGTELFNFVKERPEFWKELIRDLRKVYEGKLVYAENWDKADQVDLWQELDFIGIDAYFPLSEKLSPSEEEIISGWRKHTEMLKNLSSEYKKQVLFTEYGYRSIDYALKEPWNSGKNIANINHNLQARALKVLYEEFWTENWFSGGYLWKWHQHEDSGGIENDRFTPQNKPAENIIKEYYKKFRN